MNTEALYSDAVALLRDLIRIPSPSREEAGTAERLAAFLSDSGIETHRKKNNVWAFNRHYDSAKPTILLNSHHDTVRPNSGYTRDPYDPADRGRPALRAWQQRRRSERRIAAGGLPALLRPGRDEIQPVRGDHGRGREQRQRRAGMRAARAGPLDFAIVGEPTQMQLAIAERGLMVVDCTARGRSGHAAREEGDNAIYKAMQDIEWFRSYRFPKVSELFGAVKMTVTIISAGTQHNVVPAECRFTVDIRVTDRYTNEEVLDEIRRHVRSEVAPRSTRLKPSSIPPAHPIVRAGLALGRTTYGSPTTSDQALLDIPSLKLGVGDSARSHSADDFVGLSEIREGIDLYIRMLSAIL